MQETGCPKLNCMATLQGFWNLIVAGGILASFCCLSLSGCGRDKHGPPPALESSGRQGNELSNDDKAVVDAMIAESSGGWMIVDFERLAAQPLSVSGLRWAKDYVESHADYRSYHLLFRLRAHSEELYKSIPNDKRASVLCSMIGKAEALDDYGSLGPSGSFDDVAGVALLETGREALKYLEPMLKDKRSVYDVTDGDSTDYEAYKFRRADYAYRYVCKLIGGEPPFLPDPEDRDTLIAKLEAELNTPTPKPLDALIAESAAGKAIVESHILATKRFTEPELQLAKEYIDSHPDHTSFLPLIAVRRQSKKIYAQIGDSTKGMVLSAALQESSKLDGWTYPLSPNPDSDDFEAGKALVEIGEPALPYLKPVLADKRHAEFVKGSNLALAELIGDDGTETRKRRFRRCDFAYRFACRILGREYDFLDNPAERDRMISQLIAALGQ